MVGATGFEPVTSTVCRPPELPKNTLVAQDTAICSSGCWLAILYCEPKEKSIVRAAIGQPKRSTHAQETILPRNAQPFVPSSDLCTNNECPKEVVLLIVAHVKAGQLLSATKFLEIRRGRDSLESVEHTATSVHPMWHNYPHILGRARRTVDPGHLPTPSCPGFSATRP